MCVRHTHDIGSHFFLDDLRCEKRSQFTREVPVFFLTLTLMQTHETMRSIETNYEYLWHNVMIAKQNQIER